MRNVSIWRHKSADVKRKLCNVGPAMDFEKHKEINLLKREVEEFGQQSGDGGSRGFEQLVKNFKGSKLCLWMYNGFIIINCRYGETDQVTSA